MYDIHSGIIRIKGHPVKFFEPRFRNKVSVLLFSSFWQARRPDSLALFLLVSRWSGRLVRDPPTHPPPATS